ncbi:hypothetical protein HHL17_13170 [Chitinophaga sp. G-6-1-13]|uniref:DNA mismatch repair proteins mutS family domain-containing protein n=1 Tax=Chitinophaga fulva TaxID=2728842 RepID=A0A848GNA0_9BACT|nr:hypothetical protein [Chitinophaga fulva]NML38150.1 hypothetical protein [Chitinophaga fulva]
MMTEKTYINREIISLFDYTNNSGAKASLNALFDRAGLTRDHVMARQVLLRAFVEQWDILEDLRYQRYDFEEVHRFTTTLKHYYGEEGPDRFFLMFSKDKHRLKASCAQTVLFFDRLYKQYFEKIEQVKFPGAFQSCPERICTFLSGTETAQLAMAVSRGTALSIHDISGLLKWLLKKDASHELEHFWQSLFEFEAIWSVAKGIKTRNFVFPVFTQEVLLLEQFYHPMLKNPVRNDFSTRNNVMLLTGPNMAGKSTVLKSVTICVLLAHLGLAVPAQRCEVPFYDEFLISINVTDDIQSGYSHFMQEIMNLKTIMQQAVKGKKCFAVFDELFCGTNIDDAIDITCSTVKGLSQQKGSLFMVSTHLYQLDDLLPSDSFEAYQLEAMIEEGMPRHTYVLKRGWSRLKFGKLLFEKEGLDRLLNGIPG